MLRSEDYFAFIKKKQVKTRSSISASNLYYLLNKIYIQCVLWTLYPWKHVQI